jgi:hypothetical protein
MKRNEQAVSIRGRIPLRITRKESGGKRLFFEKRHEKNSSPQIV